MKPAYLKEWHPWFFHYALATKHQSREDFYAYQAGHEL
jgi:hypothetical protein